VAFTEAMGNTRNDANHGSIFGRVLESNECRLDALDRQGIQISVDGPTVLEFLFDRALANGTTREHRLNWMLNVAGLLNQVETEAYPANPTRIDLTAQQAAHAQLASTLASTHA
jgi:hypothetical protein